MSKQQHSQTPFTGPKVGPATQTQRQIIATSATILGH